MISNDIFKDCFFRVAIVYPNNPLKSLKKSSVRWNQISQTHKDVSNLPRNSPKKSTKFSPEIPGPPCPSASPVASPPCPRVAPSSARWSRNWRRAWSVGRSRRRRRQGKTAKHIWIPRVYPRVNTFNKCLKARVFNKKMTYKWSIFQIYVGLQE